MVENLLQGGGKIAIRYKSPGNFNPESVRLDLDDGDSESIVSHSSKPGEDPFWSQLELFRVAW